MTYRWKLEDLEAFQKRMQGSGTVRTHLCLDEHQGKPENRRAGRFSKYGNIRAEADGLTFASKRERGRWMDLRLEEKAGTIKDLKRQVEYPLEVNGLRICSYFADFTYERNGLVVEDSKGYKTDVFRLKKKLMLAVHGIEVLET